MTARSSIVLLIFSLFQRSLSAPVLGQPVTESPSGQVSVVKQQSSIFSVVGLDQLTGNTVPRFELRELEKNTDQWNVFLMGMRKFQSVDQQEKLSYYQIAGIHGRPFIPWDGVPQGLGDAGGGYCPHGSNIFGTWHRPYLSLFEEALWLNCREAVNDLSEGDVKERYKAALPFVRLPYWDWAAVPPAGQGAMPWSIQRPTIDVEYPNGTVTIDNPLATYRFHALNDTDFPDFPFSIYPETLRFPSTQNAQATSRNSDVAYQLDQNRNSLQSRVYNVLGTQHNYVDVSNDQHAGESIESVHDTIHTVIGGDGGHLYYLAYSAFDPAFWFHHANVDRLFAIWQTLNPNSYVNSQGNPYGTYTTPSNTIVDMNTPLTPFHKDDAGDFWNSNDVRSPTVFGYTYPELVGLNDTGPTELTRRVNALYGPKAVHQDYIATPSTYTGTSRFRRRAAFSTNQIAGAPEFDGRRQYVTNIKVQKFGLDGSFSTYVFVGAAPPNDPSQWTSSNSFVGVAGMLSQPVASDSSKLGIEAHGAVPLTAALEARQKNGELSSMEENVVAAYLKTNLHWRISKTDGKPIRVQDAPGFQISVLWAEVQPALTDDTFPQIVGDYQALVGATEGQPGGYATGDALG